MLKLFSISASLALGLAAMPAVAQPRPQTVQEQVALQGLPVYSSEGRHVGKVTQIRIAGDGQVASVRAELIGAPESQAKTVEIPIANFKQEATRVVLSITADEVGNLPARE
jgi:sporulation protein YlmC with PRC-barrel domain